MSLRFCWKLNSDGFVLNNGRDCGCGGVLRDCYGNLIFAFSQKLEDCSAIEAELWSIYHGVSLAWGRGFDNLIVESDCCEAMEVLNNGGNRSHGQLHQLIKGILKIGDEDMDVKWNAIGREINTVADRLAKESHKIKDMCVIVYFPPDFFVHLLSADTCGLAGPSMTCFLLLLGRAL